MIKSKPCTTGSRHKKVIKFVPPVAYKPCKALMAPLHKTGARNNQGRRTVEARGGGHKRLYRIINFKKNKALMDVVATVKTIEYDPNRNSRIALLEYKLDNGSIINEYAIVVEGMNVGDKILTSKNAVDIKNGNTMPLYHMPLGTKVCLIENKVDAGALFCRSAGSYATLVSKENSKAILSLPSGERRVVSFLCLATVGEVGNKAHKDQVYGRAGTMRLKGKRPKVRATVRNSNDHPMGGGEGKSSGGHPVNINGKSSTRRSRRNKSTNVFIISRRYFNNKK